MGRSFPVRRSAAIILAAAVAIPLSMQAARPAITTDLTKLTPAMRTLVANRGYKNPAAIAKAVRGFVRGNVYYLAKVQGGVDDSSLRSMKKAGATVRATFPEISWVALSSRVDAIARVSNLDRVGRLDVDRVQHLLGTNVQYVSASAANKWGDQHKRGTADVGAESLWAAGVDGSGVTVGVADSGVDSTHPDLNDLDWRSWGGSHPAKTSFVDCQTAVADLETIFFKNPPVPDICNKVPGYDDNGHGTHVSGIATGTAQGRGQEGLYPGMAPGANLSVAKVCLAAGSCLNSNVMAGMRYLAMEKSEGGAGADIINMSLGGSRAYGIPFLGGAAMETNDDAEAELVNVLSQQHNVLFVIAAGNSGPVLGSVANPAVASQSLAVGAAIADFDLDHPVEQTLHGEFGNIQPNAKKNHAIGLAGFSSRGPSGDRLIKPDVVAPGVYIVAPESLLGGEVHAGDFGHQHNFSYDPTYAVLSGTSMAAPSAAGVAALVWSGYKRATGTNPDYWRLKVALANTAGTKAFEGSVAGLIFGTLVHNGVGTLADHYPVRNDGSVGVTGVGAGRVNAPAALLALTKGVIAYTPKRGALDIRELQPSWGTDDVVPGGKARVTFAFRGGPAMARNANVTFKMITAEKEPAGVYLAPASWFTLPSSVKASKSRDTLSTFKLTVPSNAKPGIYEATIAGTADLGGGIKQTIRIPVQFFVRMTEPNAAVGGSSLEGPIWASDVTDYSVVGYENPIGDTYTDWTMIPLYLPKGVKRVDFSVYDVAGKDTMDLFVFDSTGEEVDSTVTAYADNIVPGGALYQPTTNKHPAKMTIVGEAPNGNDSTDLKDLTLPTTVWLAVSDTGPAKAPTMSRYHLDVDMVGAASPGIGGVTIQNPAPKPRPQASHLPATGVGVPQGIAVALLIGSAATALWLRKRRAPEA
jgi:subtilisin family serine protease